MEGKKIEFTSKEGKEVTPKLSIEKLRKTMTRHSDHPFDDSPGGSRMPEDDGKGAEITDPLQQLSDRHKEVNLDSVTETNQQIQEHVRAFVTLPGMRLKDMNDINELIHRAWGQTELARKGKDDEGREISPEDRQAAVEELKEIGSEIKNWKKHLVDGEGPSPSSAEYLLAGTTQQSPEGGTSSSVDKNLGFSPDSQHKAVETSKFTEMPKDVLQKFVETPKDVSQWRITKERLMKEYLPNNEKDKEAVKSWTTSEELWATSESWTTTIEESTQKVQDQLRSGQGKGDNREMAEEEIRRKEASPESIKTKEEKTAEREAEKRRKNAERMEIVNEWAKGLESTPNPSLEYKLHPPSSHEDSDRLYDEDSYLPDSQRPPSTLKDSDSPSGTASRDSGGSNEEARSDIATDGSEGIVNPQAKGREDRFINLYDETPMQKKGNAEYDRDIYKKDPNDLLGGDRVNKFLDKRESFEVMKYRIQSMSVRDARPIYEAWINKNILKESKWRKIEIDAMNEYFNHRLDEVIHNMLFGIEKISEENDISEEKLRKTYETCINTYTTEASPERPRLIEGMNRYFTGRGLIEGMKKHLTDGENRELINLKFRIIKMSKEEAGPICETFINAHTTEGSTERAGLIEEMNKYL